MRYKTIPTYDLSPSTQGGGKFLKLNVLIACEESQSECLAFRKLGHNAFSCDIQPFRRGGCAAWHIHGNVTPLLEGCTQFTTMDGKHHDVKHWDLIIAHPPCTYLCKVSSVHLIKNGHVQIGRYQKMLAGKRFFLKCLASCAPFVAVENPLPMARARLPKPSFFIQPSWFGVKYTKKTLFWTKNLPPLISTILYPNPKEFVRSSRGMYRSRTFPQVADAIAFQWSEYIITSMTKRISETKK